MKLLTPLLTKLTDNITAYFFHPNNNELGNTMKKIVLLCAAALILAAGQAEARGNSGFNKKNLYLGGGISNNDPSAAGAKEASGYQAFAGYKLDQVKIEDVDSNVEVGYQIISYKGGNVKGLWINYLANYALDRDLALLGRIGLDMGDDDGLMYGFGAEYALDRRMGIRGEYVVRQNSTGLQLNIRYNMK